jgi:hypothetical protein
LILRHLTDMGLGHVYLRREINEFLVRTIAGSRLTKRRNAAQRNAASAGNNRSHLHLLPP